MLFFDNVFYLYYLFLALECQFIIRSNLQYAALSALRRLPLDPGNPAFLHRAVQGLVYYYFV